MPRIVLALCLAVSPAFAATIYKWHDDNGTLHMFVQEFEGR